ncbi:MAG: peptidoglycan DD-metalloendopeptidase family protein [Clostridia bacterium]|nr:peptidoglycan DD-metalloendopeptidase family protein [Clostridia bacterium]
MAYITKTQHFLKKYRIAIVSALVFALALCAVVSFAGNESPETVIEADSSIAMTPPETVVSENGEVRGYGLYIDGNLVAAVNDKQIAEEALDQVLEARAIALGIDPAAEKCFNNLIEFISAPYAPETFVEEEQLLTMLGMRNGASASSYVSDYNGRLVSVKLAVRSATTHKETVTLEYDTKTIYTDTLRDGVTKVVSKGYNGEGEETFQIISVDGVFSEKATVSLDVTIAPANEVVRVGTSSNGKDVASLSKFQKPYDGIITSYVGPRWGRTHNGIDIVADGRGCKGDPAYAAADGVVIRADWYGGYGNCVIIDHGDGVQTLYAHFTSISVEVGDVVKAGDEVGKIGSTGNSTGPHLHFEVHVDGEIVNPLIFVDYE